MGNVFNWTSAFINSFSNPVWKPFLIKKGIFTLKDMGSIWKDSGWTLPYMYYVTIFDDFRFFYAWLKYSTFKMMMTSRNEPLLRTNIWDSNKDLLLLFLKKGAIETYFWKYLSLKLIQYLSAIVRTLNRGEKIAKLIFSRPQPRSLGQLLVGNAEYGGDEFVGRNKNEWSLQRNVKGKDFFKVSFKRSIDSRSSFKRMVST